MLEVTDLTLTGEILHVISTDLVAKHLGMIYLYIVSNN